MNTITKRRLLYFFIFTLALFAVFALFCYLTINGILHIPCVVNKLFHVSCPGCGNTHVILSLIKLDFKAAFRYNYLFPLEFLYVFYVYLSTGVTYIRTGKKEYTTFSKYIDIIVLVLILIWTVVRNIFSI